MNYKLPLIIIVIISFLSLTPVPAAGKSAKEWNKEGLLLLEKGKYEKALKCFDRALKLDPGVPQLLNNRGYALYSIGKSGHNSYYVERSIEVYNQAISAKSDYDRAYYNKGLSLMYLKKYAEAKKCFKKVLSINPSDSDAHARIKECDIAMAGHSASSSAISELMKKAGDYYDIGEYEKAAGLYEAVLAIEPNNKDAAGKKATAEFLAIHGNISSVKLSEGKSYIEIVNGVTFEMVYIKGGTFQMGQAGVAEPVHTVTVSDFYMGKYEVSNREYMMYDPTHHGNRPDGSYPVENVSWNDAASYCLWLTGKTGKVYRLPREAEWEYACRAGSMSDYYWGNTMNDTYCWYSDNSGGTLHGVGEKTPNGLGLFDMSGNVWEWCSDWSGPYPSSCVTDPSGPLSGTKRIKRGGAWDKGEDYCRSAFRYSSDPSFRDYNLGFRICCTPYRGEYK
ncbi:MAG: SUMF1/EgtB/PvdO family nonheme iron enzyme [Candidatus Eremiobacterota bacterium]